MIIATSGAALVSTCGAWRTGLHDRGRDTGLTWASPMNTGPAFWLIIIVGGSGSSRSSARLRPDLQAEPIVPSRDDCGNPGGRVAKVRQMKIGSQGQVTQDSASNTIALRPSDWHRI